jgi:hypothetical protein
MKIKFPDLDALIALSHLYAEVEGEVALFNLRAWFVTRASPPQGYKAEAFDQLVKLGALKRTEGRLTLTPMGRAWLEKVVESKPDRLKVSLYSPGEDAPPYETYHTFEDARKWSLIRLAYFLAVVKFGGRRIEICGFDFNKHPEFNEIFGPGYQKLNPIGEALVNLFLSVEMDTSEFEEKKPDEVPSPVEETSPPWTNFGQMALLLYKSARERYGFEPGYLRPELIGSLFRNETYDFLVSKGMAEKADKVIIKLTPYGLAYAEKIFHTKAPVIRFIDRDSGELVSEDKTERVLDPLDCMRLAVSYACYWDKIEIPSELWKNSGLFVGYYEAEEGEGEKMEWFYEAWAQLMTKVTPPVKKQIEIYVDSDGQPLL